VNESVPEAASELVIAGNTEAVLSKSSTHHATVSLRKKNVIKERKIMLRILIATNTPHIDEILGSGI
jgi:hypothetical protein